MSTYVSSFFNRAARASVGIRFVAPVELRSQSEAGSEHYALEIRASPTHAVWVTDGSVLSKQKVLAREPGATVLDAALMGVPTFSEDAGFISGSAAIGNGSYDITDIAYSMTNWLASRFVNQQAMSNATLTLYQAAADQAFDDRALRRTNQGDTYSDEEGKINLTFRGVHAKLKGTVFKPLTFKLARTINGTETDDFIPLKFPSDVSDPTAERLPTFQHNGAYSTDAGLNMGYLITPENEVISYVDGNVILKEVEGTSYYGFVAHERGAFGTLPVAIDVEGDTVYSNLPDLTEFVYIEEKPSDIISLGIAGVTADDRTASDRWSRMLGLESLDLEALSASAAALDSRRMRFNNPKEVDFKQWIERDVLASFGGVLVQNPKGQFALRVRPKMDGTATPVAEFDSTNLNLEKTYKLDHPTDSIRSPIIAKFDRDAINGDYRQTYEVTSQDVENKYGKVESITYEYPGWTSAYGSRSQIIENLNYLRDFHQAEAKTITVEAIAHFDHVQVGDIVHLKLDKKHLTDSSTGSPVAEDVDQSFLVIARSGSSTSAAHKYALYASTGTAEKAALQDAYRYLSDAEYERIAPTTLNSLISSTLGNDGVRVFSGEHGVAPDKWYRLDDPARFAANFKLRPLARGQFIGIAHKEALFIESTDGAIDGTGMSVYQGTDDERGSSGYIGRTNGSGQMHITVHGKPDNDNGAAYVSRTRIRSAPNPIPDYPVVFDFRPWPLTHHDGRLGGIPAMLAGSGGAGSGGVFVSRGSGEFPASLVTASSAPVAGGDGGMSALFLGPELSRSTTGVFARVDGGEPADAFSGTLNAWVGPGAPGSAGVVAIITDGNNLQPLLSGAAVKAHSGQADLSVDPLPGPVSSFNGVPDVLYRSFHKPTPHLNRWSAHSALMRVPSAEKLQDRPLNAFDRLFDAEVGFDGKMTLHPMQLDASGAPVFPQAADNNDYAAVQADLNDPNVPPENVRMWQLLNNRWQIVQFPDVAAEWKVTSYRERGSTVLWVTPNRPAIGTYRIGDSWYDRNSRRMYILGGSAAEDELVDPGAFGDVSGFTLNVDPTFAGYLSGLDTLRIAQNFNDPLSLEGIEVVDSNTEQPGTTSDQYYAQPMIPWQYELPGDRQWVQQGDHIQAVAGGPGGGDCVAFYGHTLGFVGDDDFRDVWILARNDAATVSRVTIQAANAADNAGTPDKQIHIEVQSSDWTWIKLLGPFAKYSAQLQVRTQDAISVKRVILITNGSTSVPVGDAGFGGSTGAVGTSEARRAYWPVNVTTDRLKPLKQGGNDGPVTIGLYGEGGTAGVLLDFSGATPNLFYERFPWRPHAGRQYRCSIRVRIDQQSNHSNPAAMGVAIQFEAYNAKGVRVLTTDVRSGGSEEWLSASTNGFKTQQAVVDVPANAGEIYWAAFKVVALGDGGGQVYVSECYITELPYRVWEFKQNTLNLINGFAGGTGPTDPGGGNYTFTTVNVDGRRGMRIDSQVGFNVKVDAIDPTNAANLFFQYPEAYIFVRLRYVDENGAFVSQATLDAIQYVPRISAQFASKSVLSTDASSFRSSGVLVSTHDFTEITFGCFLLERTDVQTTSDLLMDNVEIRVLYGENFTAGNNG